MERVISTGVEPQLGVSGILVVAAQVADVIDIHREIVAHIRELRPQFMHCHHCPPYSRENTGDLPHVSKHSASTRLPAGSTYSVTLPGDGGVS